MNEVIQIFLFQFIYGLTMYLWGQKHGFKSGYRKGRDI